ncbi:MAG: HAD family hydrolase [Oscillospiraceae bacterium]|nr:HAD family hydrolase [Oscillospiraceae bacterium]
MDGTLLDDKKNIPPENEAAIKEMLERGHSVIITTGRPLSGAVFLAERLGLTTSGCYLVAYNGGILYDTAAGKVIYRSTLPLEAVRKTFEEANRRGIHIQTYRDPKVLVEPRCDDEAIRIYCEKIHVDYEVINSINDLEQEPVKMLIIDFNDPTPLEEFREWIASWASESIDTFFSCNEYVEIVRKGLNKGNAVVQMAKILQIPVENTIAAGDAANDITMIRASGVGCAMANAAEEVKKCADYITELDNNQGGVAEIIKRFILD